MKKLMVPFFILILISSLLPQGFPPAEKIILKNGFNGLFLPRSNSPLFTAIVVVKTGLGNESPELNGVSHMLEHMTFNGTELYNQDSLYSMIDRYGLYINAQTSDDYTSFMVMGANRDFNTGVRILSDMLFRSNFPESNFNKEKGIILAELEKDESSPYYKKELMVRRWLYGNSIYGLPVLGTRKTIQLISRKQMIKYYKTYYYPGNMTVFLIGNLDNSQVLSTLKKYFGKQPLKNQPKLEIVDQNVSLPHKPFIIREKNLTLYHIADKAPSPQQSLFPFYYLLGETILQEIPLESLQLPDSILNKLHEVSAEFNYHPQLGRLIWVIQANKNLSNQELQNVHKELKNFLYSQAEPDQISHLIHSNWISENILLDKILYYAFLKSKVLANIGPEFYLNYFPFIEKNIPNFSDWLQPTPSLLNQPKIAWYLKSTSSSRKESHQNAVSSNIIRVYKKMNQPVVVAQQDASTNLTSIHVLFRNKTSLEGHRYGMAEFSHFLFKRRTPNYTSAQIDSIIQHFGLQIKWHDNYFIPFDDYYQSSSYGYVRLMSMADYTDQAICLLGSLIQNPSLTDLDIHKVAPTFKMMAGKRAQSAADIFKFAFRKRLCHSDCDFAIPPYGQPDIVDSLSRDDISTFLRQYTANENLIISVISPQNPDSIYAKVLQYFKHSNPINTKPVSSVHLKGFSDSILIQDSKSQQFVYGAVLPFHSPFSHFTDLQLFNKMINDEITFVVREKKGLAYRMGSQIDTLGNTILWTISGMIRPGSYQSVRHLIDSVVTSLQSKRIEKSDILKYKSKSKAKILRRFSSQENLAWLLGMQVLSGEYSVQVANKIIQQRLQEIDRASLQKGRLLFFKALNLNRSSVEFYTK